MTSVLSILHRATGLIIALGALIIAWWLWSAMHGPEAYATAAGFLNSVFGRVLMFVWVICTFYHLCNGIRHLIWDAGWALELEQAYLGGKIVLAAAVVLTILVYLL